MKGQVQTVAEEPVICKVELFDFLMTMGSLVTSMTDILLNAESGGNGGGKENATEKT